MLIGFSGYATAGKDTAALALIEERGFRRIGFADKLREFALAIDPIVEVGAYGASTRLSQVVHADGWTAAKRVPEVRIFLQRLGTEAGRRILGENVWIDAALRDVAPCENVVVTDVRFPNEAEAIAKLGGEVWRVERPGLTAVNAHASETALDEFPFPVRLVNGGSIEQLRTDVLVAYASRIAGV